MYDVEMMQMLSLIHHENAMIFEMVRSTAPADVKKITFESYQKAYDEIIESTKKYSNCSTCE